MRLSEWPSLLVLIARPIIPRGKYVGQTFDHCVDFIARRCAPEAEADGAHAHLGRDAHRFQNRRQLDAAGVTRRSRRGRDTIEPRQYLGADPADEGNIERVRQAMRRMSVEDHAITELLLQLLPEVVAQGAHPIHGRKVARKLAGLAEPDRKQRALGAGAPATLVPGAVDQRFD